MPKLLSLIFRIVALMFFMGSFALGPAHALVFNVDRIDDDAGAMGCDDAVADDCSLRGAILKANGTTDLDEIVLQAETYTLEISTGGVAEDAAATGDLDVTEDLTLTGAGADQTTIDGNGTITGDRVFHLSPSGTAITVNISGVKITGGESPDGATASASGGSGGGILIGGGTITLDKVAVSGNQAGNGQSGLSGGAGGSGGGIAINAGNVTIANSTISRNATGNGGSATDPVIGGAGSGGKGGGISVDAGNITLRNVTLSGNLTGAGGTSANLLFPGTGGPGGGLGMFGIGTIVTINNSTITNNTTGTGPSFGRGGSGGGVAVVVVGTLNLSNSILADNTIAPTGFGPDCNGNVTSQGFNLLGDNTDCTFSGSDGVNGDDVGTGASPIVPGLSPLQDNGGPTETHALEDTSPAIDSGDDASCEPTDQRGDTRPTDGDQDGAAHCDKGAFELGRCGDGVTQPDEQCDDGNTTNGDGCNSLCEDEPDNGNDNNNGGCSLSTSPSLPSPRAPWALLGLGAMGAVAYFRRGGFIR